MESDKGWEASRTPRSLGRLLKGSDKAEAQRGQVAHSRPHWVTEPDFVPFPVQPPT